MEWPDKHVLVTGGAGFIGSRLCERLMEMGARLTIVDDLSEGTLQSVLDLLSRQNHNCVMSDDRIRAGPHSFLRVDLKDLSETMRVVEGQEVVFNLAARIGGRGYIETHPADCCENIAIDYNVIRASRETGVRHVHYASTACVYPVQLQSAYDSTYLLNEDDAFRDGCANSDREYGWAKLMGEMILRAYHAQYGLEGSVCRYVTAYGPRENDTHAIIALIKRAVERQDPYVIWGTGEQDRDFTYVDDIVEGSIRAAEVIKDGSAVNLGTSIRYKIKDVADLIFEIVGWRPSQILYDTSKPEGVRSRSLDITRAKEMLGWFPRYGLREGLERTVEWYVRARPASVGALV